MHTTTTHTHTAHSHAQADHHRVTGCCRTAARARHAHTQAILRDGQTLKVGVNIRGDVAKLASDYGVQVSLE